MKIFTINKSSIVEAVSILRAGGTVVYPTETAYALGCDATDKKAIAKIFKIKNRPKEKGLPVICATKKMVADFFKFGKIEKKLAKKYWPGPLSIVLFWADNGSLCDKNPQRLPLHGIPVRISSDKTARDLARKLGKPVISTSANISGAGAIYDSKKIIAEFTGKKYQPASTRKRGEPDLILDGGKLPRRLPSTIIKIIKNVKSSTLNIEVIRQGGVKI